MILPNLHYAIQHSLQELKTKGIIRKTEKWQGISVERPMLELDNLYWRCQMPPGPVTLQRMTGASQPWGEEHFNERVSGKPVNPGETYKIWPYYGNKNQSDAQFRNESEKFSHTYMERYWPKLANESTLGMLSDGPEELAGYAISRMGIRYHYGDLEDVVSLLVKEPQTRQAFLPVWFPEDTGVVHGGRVPCTIGYHFIIRDNQFNVHYLIRACDALRHFRNDLYLTIRLAQWVLASMQLHEFHYTNIKLGMLTFDCINFHVFENEKNLI